MPFSDEEVRGLRETLPADTEIFIEYMDTKRRHDASYMTLLAQIYELKYAGKKFDAILSLDDDALNFLLANVDRIFPGNPIVFCGVNSHVPERLAGRTMFTGVIETMDIEPTLKIGLQLYPEARQILVITDRSTTGLSNRGILERIAAAGRLGKPMRFLDDGAGLDLSELLSRLRAEKEPSLVYYSDFFLDRHGHTLDIGTVMPQVAGVAPGPVMVHSGMYLGHGALGGKINSGFYQGAMAAELAMRIWHGEKPGDIPVVHEDINTVTLDYRMLKRWRLDTGDLSPTERVELVNKPEDMFHGYGRYLLAALAFIILESVLILLLLKLLRQQRRLRAEAIQREALLQSVLESAPVPLSYARLDGRIMAVNSALTRVLGYTLADIPSITDWWAAAYPDPGDREVARARWQRITRTGGRENHEFRLTAKDGSVRDVLIGTTSQDQFIIASFFDITERKLSEELLRQSEEKFSRIFQMAPEGIAFMRLSDAVIIDANSAFEAITGYSSQELIGKSARDLHAWANPGDEQEYMRGLAADGKVLNFEFTFRHRDGSMRSALLSAQRVSMAGEDCVVSITHDTTDTKRMQEMMIQTEKMLSVGGIAAGIAHEINNPLGIILQNAQTLAQRMDCAFPKNLQTAEAVGLDLAKLEAYSKARRLDMFIADIQSAAIRAASIIRHLLDFSRRSESRRAVCQIESILERAINLASNDFDLKKSFDFKRVTISRDYDAHVPALSCTETEIEQVFLNLLRNAAQAMAESGREPRIDIRTWADAEMAYAEIRDNGPGIPAEIQRRIFEPFFTTKGPGIGTGLGLSVSYFIVTKGHDGVMTVDSAPGQGCVFTIGLPLAPAGICGE
jgi:PAS domain S-box-containing protein